MWVAPMLGGHITVYASYFYVNCTQTRVILEEEPQLRKRPYQIGLWESL